VSKKIIYSFVIKKRVWQLPRLTLCFIISWIMIFYPQQIPPDYRLKFSKYEITINNNGNNLHGWFVKKDISKDSPLIIYYGGNAEEVSGNLWNINDFKTGSFLFMNYRGYGDSEGKPSEINLCSDALFIVDYIAKKEKIPLENVVIMGRSLGSGVAAYVAKHRDVGSLILVTPFDSLLNVAKSHYPVFPVSLLLRHRFDSLSYIHKIKLPMISIIGTEDDVIPNKNSMNLFKHWGGPKELITITGAGHNNIDSYDQYWKSINSFLTGNKKH